MNTQRIVFAACCAALLATMTAKATSLVRLSLEQLTEASSAVLQGHVISQTSQWNARHTEIITLTTLAVDQNLKGNTASVVTVEQLGGTVGRLRVAVPGTMHFYQDAKYELFLERSPANASRFLLVGMRQGACRIFTDPATHQERVMAPSGGMHRETDNGSAAAMPLDQFQQRVQSAASATLVIPSGATIPLAVRSVAYAGVGRVQIEAVTSADVYPSARLIIPAGSLVDGWGQESAGQWTLHWTAVSIRGVRARLKASSSAASARDLQGRRFTVIAR